MKTAFTILLLIGSALAQLPEAPSTSVHLRYSPLYTYCYREWTERPHCWKGQESLPFALADAQGIWRGTWYSDDVKVWVKPVKPRLLALQPHRTLKQTLLSFHYLAPSVAIIGLGVGAKLRCRATTVTCGGWEDAILPPIAVVGLAEPVDQHIGTIFTWPAFGIALWKDGDGTVTGHYH